MQSMDVKVQCPCGQAYQFEVEPVNNLMPCAVNCPACGADGTQLANESIAQSVSPVMAAAAVPAYSAPPESSGLRINRPPPPVAAAPAAPDAAVPVPAYPPTRQYIPKLPVPPAKAIPLGILGGVIAGGIGMAVWYFLTVATGKEFGVAAWFLGALTGIGVRVLARDGSPMLGYVAAVCACLSILGGQFLAVNTYINRGFVKGAEKAYLKQISLAKEAVNAKSDQEIKSWLRKNQDDGTLEISQADIDAFRDHDQAKMQQLLDGNPSEQEYLKMVIDRIPFSMRFKIFQGTMSLFTILWLVFGIGSAWRIGSK